MACSGTGDQATESGGSAEATSIRGYSFFVNNIEEVSKKGSFAFPTRDGAGEDLGHLQGAFGTDGMGFQWQNCTAYWHRNLTLDKWDHKKGDRIEQATNDKECCIKCHIQSMDHSKSDYFLLAISSHGVENTEAEVLFSDCRSLRLSEIVDALSNQNCPTRKDKIKILILQMCRVVERSPDSAKDDRGADVQYLATDLQTGGEQKNEDQYDGPSRFTVEPVHEEYGLERIQTTHLPKDFIVLFPTTPGKRALRNTIDGSWMLEKLNDVIKKEKERVANLSDEESKLKKTDFLKLITEVTRRVAFECESKAYKKKPDGEFERDENNNTIVDPPRTGNKSAVCVYHTLCSPCLFNFSQATNQENESIRENESTPENESTDIDLTAKKKKKKKTNTK